jgi:hypothetical protein
MRSLLSIIKIINRNYWYFFIKSNTITNYIIKHRNISRIKCHKFCRYLVKRNKVLFNRNIIKYNKIHDNYTFNKNLIKNKYFIFFRD